MKKKILLLAAMLVVLTTVQASDDLWVDVNFTRDSTMWKEAFPALAPDGLHLLSRPIGEYLGFGIDGAFGKFALSHYTYNPFNAENLTERFVYAVRLANNATSYWSFPETADVGKIKVHALSSNATVGSQFTLQKVIGMEGPDRCPTEIWSEFDPVVTFTVPPHAFSTTSFVVEKTLNLTEPTRLRLKGPTLRHVHIYAMSISKNINTSVDENLMDQDENLMDQIQIHVLGRSLEVRYSNMDFTATVFNLVGVNMGKIRQGETYTLPVAGTYLVRVETLEGTITKKVVVL